ncbi:Plasmodium exported protein, unknown function [Plasmodium relictum]|uniref:Uncharacterized protein n=1 Tax=Plasmodium relictum TaxID=85471 RepID=A0A1J1GNU0_PLARL|nr:Plasmodium exported protein, unknown function [Plasmodium relictum]CRG85786.1 Plasmodium exported protein, unknown function [Plasmodium relictum]
MNSCNNQSNLFTKGTFTIRKMGLNYYSINSFKNDKEKCKSVNHINLNSYKLFIALFFYFSYFLLQNMIQPKNKISELNLIKDNLRIMFEGQGEANKDVSDMNQIKLTSLDDGNENNDENGDNSENENDDKSDDENNDGENENSDEIESEDDSDINDLDINKDSYNAMLNCWRKRCYDTTNIITSTWFQWYCGVKTKDMDEQWKDEMFESWQNLMFGELLEEDKKNIHKLKKMIKKKSSADSIQKIYKKGDKLWKKRMRELRKEWKDFMVDCLEMWEDIKDHTRSDDEDDDERGAPSIIA